MRLSTRCNTDLEFLTFESVAIDVPSGERCDEVDVARNVTYGHVLAMMSLNLCNALCRVTSLKMVEGLSQ